MNNGLKVINKDGILLTDSREVAEMVGKRHDHLIRDIQGYIKVLDQNPNLGTANFFIESTYTNKNNQSYKCYLLTKQGCEMVANKMTGEKGILFTAEYVQAFNAMESTISCNLKGLSKELQAIFIMDKKQQQFESRLTKIENNSTIDYSQQENLRELANKVVVQALGGNEAPAYKELGKKAFSSLWNEYKRILKVNSYKNTLVKNYEKGIEFISNWKPTKELKYTIEGCNAQIRM